MKYVCIIALLMLLMGCKVSVVSAQLKTVIEDFEGMADGQQDFGKEGIFAYGAVELMADQTFTTGFGYSGSRAMRIGWNGQEWFGGFGLGLGLYKELDQKADYFNCYVLLRPTGIGQVPLRIILEDDDNFDAVFNPEHDDQWYADVTIAPSDEWQLLSVPLATFAKMNTGGDGIFNLSHSGGMLLTVIFDFPRPELMDTRMEMYLDFISFSEGPLPQGDGLFRPAEQQPGQGCLLGAWSDVPGKETMYREIARSFEQQFTPFDTGRVWLTAFYKPLSVGTNSIPDLFPDLEQLQLLINAGYVPMITLETQYTSKDNTRQQPNLYALIEGHYDFFFADWARRIKSIEGTVLLRILHEFNGDWYPWTIVQNYNDPELFVQAFRHIHGIFQKEGATNVRFVWSPNSMSTPQAPWNFIIHAYPGDAFVDVIALDVFNGAGQPGVPVWRSFRKEAMDNYYLIRKHMPGKTLIIGEVSSRERMPEEVGHYESKADWIAQMAEALKTDMNGIRAFIWFNEYDHFRVNSSPESRAALLRYFWADPYFQSAPPHLLKEP